MNRQIDRQSLAKYFLYGFIPAPATIFKGVKKPIVKKYLFDYSHQLTWGQARIKKEAKFILNRTIKKYLKKIKKYPLGIFLSGGVDSSLITAKLAEFIPAAKIIAFSVSFKEKHYDESYFAKIVAKKFGLRHQIINFLPSRAAGLLKQVVNFLDEPMADPSLLPTYLAFIKAKKKVTDAFLGDAGDENFAGYPKYLAHGFLEKTHLNKLPLAVMAKLFSGRLATFFRYASYPLYLRNQLWISVFSPEEVDQLTGEKVNFNDLVKYHRLFKGCNPLDEAFFLDQNLTFPYLYLNKTHVASIATGLKIHCPFSDKKMFEFCSKIPFGMKLKGFKTKALLKEISLDYLPGKIVKRPKVGFGLPISLWLKNELKPLVLKELNPAKIKKEGIINSRTVNKILTKGTAHQIWTLLIFELWLKKGQSN